jgi:polysaccharide export outer membrane protein
MEPEGMPSLSDESLGAGPTARIGARLGFMVGLVSATLFGIATVSAAEYRIQPGDVLRYQLVQVDPIVREATVGVNGGVDLAWIGRVAAAGKDIDELRSEVHALARSAPRIVQRHTNTGDPYAIEIDPAGIVLEIGRWRPVMVMGDVARPGEVEFRPGLTVRMALATSGGVGLFGGAAARTITALDVIRLMAEERRASEDLAAAAAALWRIESEMAEQDAPAIRIDGVDAARLDALLEGQRRLARFGIDAARGQRALNADLAAKAAERIDVLRKQAKNQAVALKDDEAEEKRVRDLIKRGLARTDRITQTKRDSVQSAQRLLAIEQNISTATIELARLEATRDQFDSERMARLLLERESAAQALSAARQRHAEAQLLVSAASLGSPLLADAASAAIDATLHRTVAGVVQTAPVALDDPLQPNDVVEFAVRVEAPPATGGSAARAAFLP